MCVSIFFRVFPRLAEARLDSRLSLANRDNPFPTITVTATSTVSHLLGQARSTLATDRGNFADQWSVCDCANFQRRRSVSAATREKYFGQTKNTPGRPSRRLHSLPGRYNSAFGRKASDFGSPNLAFFRRPLLLLTLEYCLRTSQVHQCSRFHSRGSSRLCYVVKWEMPS